MKLHLLTLSNEYLSVLVHGEISNKYMDRFKLLSIDYFLLCPHIWPLVGFRYTEQESNRTRKTHTKQNNKQNKNKKSIKQEIL